MKSQREHYQSHLAPIYVWMVGGFESAVERGSQEVEDLVQELCTQRDSLPSKQAVDLGAGFGMHAIPLAQRGYSVLALDSSTELLEHLQNNIGALPIEVVEDDLLRFEKHLKAQADLVLCMGDTLLHLPSEKAVLSLFARVFQVLKPGGLFACTFRDYTIKLAETARFIPVKSDDQRILTCHLEYAGNFVTVTDLIHELKGCDWELNVSAYRKLRLAPEWIAGALADAGFTVRTESGRGGMVRVMGVRA